MSFARTLQLLLPNMSGVSSQTTLGELYSRAYTQYPRRLIYPVLGWAGLLYYTLWTPYTAPAVKQAQKERLDKLAALEFHQ